MHRDVFVRTRNRIFLRNTFYIIFPSFRANFVPDRLVDLSYECTFSKVYKLKIELDFSMRARGRSAKFSM